MRLGIWISLCFCCWFFQANAQSACPEIPKQYAWNSSEEYLADQPRVKEVLKWLCNEPLGFEIQKRSLANAYAMEWITGTPSLRLEVNSEAFLFIDQHPELLFSLIQGMAYYAIGHPDEKDLTKLHTEALEVVAQHAEQSEVLSKDGDLKKLIRANRKKQLKAYYQDSIEDWEKAKQNH